MPYFSFALEVFRNDLALVELEKIDRKEKCERLWLKKVQTLFNPTHTQMTLRVLHENFWKELLLL